LLLDALSNAKETLLERVAVGGSFEATRPARSWRPTGNRCGLPHLYCTWRVTLQVVFRQQLWPKILLTIFISNLTYL
jgi:hypothetical protein